MLTDFSRSYLTWLTHDNSYGRFQLEAICSVKTPSGITQLLLANGVMAADVYGEADLFFQPAFQYQIAFSAEDYKIWRTHLPQRAAADSTGPIQERFQWVKPHLESVSGQELTTFDALAQATLNNEPLMAEVELDAGVPQTTIALQFPVKHINLRENDAAYQIETGPILMPGNTLNLTDIGLAYIALSHHQKAEVITFETMPVGKHKVRTFGPSQRLAGRWKIFTLNNPK